MGCSLIDQPEYQIQPELQPFVDDFYQEAAKRGFKFGRDNLIVQIKSGIRERHNGLAITSKDTGPGDKQIRIFIDADYYYNNPFECIEQTMYHEFGHALLNRGHTNTYSIMNSGVPRCWNKGDEEFRKCMIDELFGAPINVLKCLNPDL